MTAVAGILKGVGMILLAIFCILILFVILLLLVPFRYHLVEKGGGSETYHVDHTDPGGELTVSWLLHFLHVRMNADYREKKISLKGTARVLGIPVFRLQKEIAPFPVMKVEQESEEMPEKEKETDGEGKKSDSMIRGLFEVLKEDRGGAKTEKIKKHLGGILKNILPRKGTQKIMFGTGDPFETAKILGAAAFFYPIYKNVIEIIPDMAGNSLYSEGDFSGKIFLGSVLFHAAVLYFDKDIKNLLKRSKGEN